MALYDDDDLDDRPRSRRRRHDDDDEYDDDRDERRRRRRRYEDDEEDYDFAKRDEPHSGIGIASLVLAVVAGIAMLVLFAIAGVMAGDDAGGLDEESPAAMALGAFALLAGALTLVGLCLGIGALLQKDRNKLFGVIGVIANALVLFGSGGLICLGALMG
jgi:hypothetical protein